MKIGFVVNSLATEKVNYTTTHLAETAVRRGHEVWYIPVDGFTIDPDERVHAHAFGPPRDNYRSAKTFLSDLQSDACRKERISVYDLGILMLRNDPAEDVVTRPWARLAPLYFGRLAATHGVIVLNDPEGLGHAINKSYLELFPQAIRPRSLITRSQSDIVNFIHEQRGPIILKPLAGSGGHNVFLLGQGSEPNLNQIIEAVLSEGYGLCQEYLPKAIEGDTRVFMMNGRILERDGKFATIRRRRPGSDLRSNMSIGGTSEPGEITDAIKVVAEGVRPQLVKDGLFFAGLDVIDDKLIEINVFSPGGLFSASRFAEVNFFDEMIDNLESKLTLLRQEPGGFNNREIASL